MDNRMLTQLYLLHNAVYLEYNITVTYVTYVMSQNWCRGITIVITTSAHI